MSLPATVSIAASAVGVTFALLVLRVSSGPGWREWRYFGLATFWAALFAAGDSASTLSLPSSTVVLASRFTLSCAGLFFGTFYAYAAAQEKRALRRWEMVIGAGCIVFALLAFVPNLILLDEVRARRLEWLNVTYQDAIPTALGSLACAYYAVSGLILVVRYVGAWRRGVPAAGAHALGLSLLVAAGVNDSFAVSGYGKTPYLVSVGFLALCLLVGQALAARFVDGTRSLEDYSRRLTDAQQQLIARERLASLGELSAVIAHEVRNPVGVMFNALAVLRKVQAPNAEASVLLGILQEEADRLKRMVADLRDFAQPRELSVSTTCLEQIVAGAVVAARGELPEDFEVEVHFEQPTPTLGCDEQLLRQALINLVTNAARAPQRRGPVRVSVRTVRVGDRPHVDIEVADDGAGVPNELRERIFTPFFTTRPTGTGLGLPVARRIAEAHGGDLELESGPSGGATFRLRLPLDQTPSVVLRAVSRRSHPGSSNAA